MSKLTKELAVRYVTALSRVVALAELSVNPNVGLPGNNIAAFALVGNLIVFLEKIATEPSDDVAVDFSKKPSLPNDQIDQATENNPTMYIDTLLQELTLLKSTIVTSSTGNPGDAVVVTFDIDNGPVATIVIDHEEKMLDLATIQRKAKTLVLGEQIGNDVFYHTFEVARFDRTWTSMLDVNTKYSVEA